jgi:hypothetical protein
MRYRLLYPKHELTFVTWCIGAKFLVKVYIAMTPNSITLYNYALKLAGFTF